MDKGFHSVPLIAIGTGLLWFGWFGFNSGNEYAADALTVQAFFNTDVAAAFAAIAWLLMAWKFEKKPKFVGLMVGMLAGLVVITPAAGFVTIGSAALIGVVAGIVCYLAVNFKNMMKWDDALDVWGVHGVGGFIGIILLGILGSKEVFTGATAVPWTGGADPRRKHIFPGASRIGDILLDLRFRNHMGHAGGNRQNHSRASLRGR